MELDHLFFQLLYFGQKYNHLGPFMTKETPNLQEKNHYFSRSTESKVPHWKMILCPPEKASTHFFPWKAFSKFFSFEKELGSISGSISSIWLVVFWGVSSPPVPPAPYLCDVSEAFLEEVDAIDLAISALERFGQAPSVQDEMHFSAFFGVATETWMLRKV